jgi:hypothetical protein
MKKILAAIFFLTLTNLVFAGENPIIRLVDTETTLESFAWTHRPILVFANSPNDINFERQVNMLQSSIAELKERDVVVLLDTDPKAKSMLRKTVRPRGFVIILVGKDGQIKLRKPFPWDVRSLSRAIDKMPMRRQEMKNSQ